MSDPRVDFRATILRKPGADPGPIEPGRLHRIATRDWRGDDAGFCKQFDDLRGGVCGCNRWFSGQVFTGSGIGYRARCGRCLIACVCTQRCPTGSTAR